MRRLKTKKLQSQNHSIGLNAEESSSSSRTFPPTFNYLDPDDLGSGRNGTSALYRGTERTAVPSTGDFRTFLLAVPVEPGPD